MEFTTPRKMAPTKDSGGTAKPMAMVLLSTKMEISMKDTTIMMRGMVKEKTGTLMARGIKVISQIVIRKALAFTIMAMAIGMKEVGKTTCAMARVRRYMSMVRIMKESGKKTRNMETAYYTVPSETLASPM